LPSSGNYDYCIAYVAYIFIRYAEAAQYNTHKGGETKDAM